MAKVVVTKSSLDSLAQHINTKAGTTGAKTIAQMQATVDGITGGDGSEVSVNTDAGATVTAATAGVTITAVEDAGGVAKLELSKAGTWTIQASKGGIEGLAKIYPVPPVITLPVAAVANLAPTSGVTYTYSLEGLTAEEVSKCAAAISDNSEITNATSTVYIDFGSIHRKVSVGARVTIPLNGTDYYFDVIGFNHDTLTTPTVYGATTKTGKAGITFQMHDLSATDYKMNSANTNSGGWKSSAMRTQTMAVMKGYMPAAWQTAIKPVNKASGIGGGSSSDTETVSDNCFLLAEVEIFGSTPNSVPGEGTQYAYYKAGNSTVKNRGVSAGLWWERSPRPGNSSHFCHVYINGKGTWNTANSGYGVAFGFCV